MKKNTVFILILWALSLQAQYADGFELLQNSKALKGAQLGVCFVDIESGQVVFGENVNNFFYPASVQKTITTAAALSLLGNEFQYQTSSYYTGIIESGVLKGNLIIIASGDPTTNSAYFNPNFKADLIAALKVKGITRIDGEVIFNDLAGNHRTPQSWLYEDIGNYYGVAPQLFNYKDNLYKLSFQQKENGQTPVQIKIIPEVPYSFDYQLTCSSTKKGDNAYILGSPFTTEREVAGTISAGVGTFTIKGANAHPQYTLLAELKEEIEIESQQKYRAGNSLELSKTSSPKLTEIVQTTNFESVNLFAEGLLNTLGLEFSQDYSSNAGIEVIEDYIIQKQLNSKEIILKDGSGLSRLNSMTPAFAAKWICEHFENEAFRESLPVSGETGTMRYLNQPGIKGKIHAKSGSAEGVVNYTGYYTAFNGKQYAFAIFVNQAYQSKYSIRREIGVYLEGVI